MAQEPAVPACCACAWWTPLVELEATGAHLPVGWGRCAYAAEATGRSFNARGLGYFVDRHGVWHAGSPAVAYGLPLTPMMVFQEFGEDGTALLTAPDFSCRGFVSRPSSPSTPAR